MVQAEESGREPVGLKAVGSVVERHSEGEVSVEEVVVVNVEEFVEVSVEEAVEVYVDSVVETMTQLVGGGMADSVKMLMASCDDVDVDVVDGVDVVVQADDDAADADVDVKAATRGSMLEVAARTANSTAKTDSSSRDRKGVDSELDHKTIKQPLPAVRAEEADLNSEVSLALRI